MENWEVQRVVDELLLGQEITKRLQIHLNMPSSSTQSFLMFVQQIKSSFDKALYIVNHSSFKRDPVMHPAGFIAGTSDSLASVSGRSWSTIDAHSGFNDPQHPNDGSRERSIEVGKQQVKVSPGIGLEDPLDDGFCWRIYDQKYIFGSRYRRGYYRCAEGTVEACSATKQVQRSDEDPTVYEITYYNYHTCTEYQFPEKLIPAGVMAEEYPLIIQQEQYNVLDFGASADQPLDQSSFEFASTSEIIPADQSQQAFLVHDTFIVDFSAGLGSELDPNFTF